MATSTPRAGSARTTRERVLPSERWSTAGSHRALGGRANSSRRSIRTSSTRTNAERWSGPSARLARRVMVWSEPRHSEAGSCTSDRLPDQGSWARSRWTTRRIPWIRSGIVVVSTLERARSCDRVAVVPVTRPCLMCGRLVEGASRGALHAKRPRSTPGRTGTTGGVPGCGARCCRVMPRDRPRDQGRRDRRGATRSAPREAAA
jgi:hypothetical protein